VVGHDCGGALALDWAARHPQQIRGVALMETVLRPLAWAEYPKPADELFRALRRPGIGEQIVLEENWFIETAIRASSHAITDDERNSIICRGKAHIADRPRTACHAEGRGSSPFSRFESCSFGDATLAC
jgi:pimeloyl-ACP methyl ester carboxylesterase